MLLAPCPACRRHIAGDSCPFCGAVANAALLAPTPLGRMSRAVVFAGAAGLGAGAGPKANPAGPGPQEIERGEERHHGGGGCSPADPAKVEELEKKKAATTDEAEKAEIDQELARARQPVCMPYGAPPSRRRVV